MSGRRIELSATQVIASMLAAVTGAILASYTGIAGTVIGVAVMSVISTAGAAVYKHYLGRSKERLRSAAVIIVPRANLNGSAGHRARQAASVSAGATARSARAGAEPAREVAGAVGTARLSAGAAEAAARRLGRRAFSPDHVATEEFPAISGRENTHPHDLPPATAAGLTGVTANLTDITARLSGAGDAGRAEITDRAHGNTGDGRAGQSTGSLAPAASASSRGRLRWPAMAAAALGIFVFTLGGITAFEVAAGKPLEALIWGRSGGGTTVGDFTGAQHTGPAARARPHPATPAGKPTGKPAPTPSVSPSPSRSPSPSPSPTASPSPSPSPSPTSSPSPSGSASPS
jgi:hypothetical protein